MKYNYAMPGTITWAAWTRLQNGEVPNEDWKYSKDEVDRLMYKIWKDRHV